MEEIWKDIPDYEGFYQASNLGRIRSVDRRVNCYLKSKQFKKGKILKTRINEGGYEFVTLQKNGHGYSTGVHRLIARTFIPNPENKKTVNHRFGIKQDNRATE